MINTEMIQKAVDWWADRITSSEGHSNGDYSLASIMGCALADSMMEPISDEKIAIFKEELFAQTETTMRERGVCYLACEYRPYRELAAAADKAGINRNNFPYKVDALIRSDGVVVSDGYRARNVWIYKVKGDG